MSSDCTSNAPGGASSCAAQTSVHRGAQLGSGVESKGTETPLLGALCLLDLFTPELFPLALSLFRSFVLVEPSFFFSSLSLLVLCRSSINSLTLSFIFNLHRYNLLRLPNLLSPLFLFQTFAYVTPCHVLCPCRISFKLSPEPPLF